MSTTGGTTASMPFRRSKKACESFDEDEEDDVATTSLGPTTGIGGDDNNNAPQARSAAADDDDDEFTSPQRRRGSYLETLIRASQKSLRIVGSKDDDDDVNNNLTTVVDDNNNNDTEAPPPTSQQEQLLIQQRDSVEAVFVAAAATDDDDDDENRNANDEVSQGNDKKTPNASSDARQQQQQRQQQPTQQRSSLQRGDNDDNDGDNDGDDGGLDFLSTRLIMYQEKTRHRLVQVQLRNVSYFVPVHMDVPSVKTVLNQSVCYLGYEVIRRIHWYCQKGRRDSGNGKNNKNKKRDDDENDDKDAETPGQRTTTTTTTGRRTSWFPRRAEDIYLPYAKRAILKNLQLVFEPGKTYLVLGPPGCGKTTLLKAVAGMLPSHKKKPMNGGGEPHKNKPHMEGRVEYNGVTVEDDPSLVLPNVVSFVGQLDNHAPYLTVRETFAFAFECRSGGKHENVMSAETSASANQLDEDRFTENLTIDGLGLAVCADTFVGNAVVRGVSGGQRRRVTVGEMMQGQAPVACADEISTGLDAAATYDIIHSIVSFSKAAKTTRIISLLQPGPETFALFDQVILLAEGMVVYAGPIGQVVAYFASLGYTQPPTMDVADFLQSIPTPDGNLYFNSAKGPADQHLSAEEFATAFEQSAQYQQILRLMQDKDRPYDWRTVGGGRSNNNATETAYGDAETSASATASSTKRRHHSSEITFSVPKEFRVPYQNSSMRSMMLNFKRHFTLWKRDLGFIIGKMFENIGMAAATGGILFGRGRLPANVVGQPLGPETVGAYATLIDGVYAALFMTCFHILLGTMTSAPDEVDGRAIHYKHYDAKFYQVFSFVFGRLISTLPQRTIELCAFGIPLYFLVGLTATPAAFFTYIAILICYTTGLKMMFGILAQTLPKKQNVLGAGGFFVLIMALFGGFIVYPDTVPPFYKWLYWLNPMAWCLQGLATNEFTSGKYNVGRFNADVLLTVRGFQLGRQWLGYTFAYLLGFTLVSTIALAAVLAVVRISPTNASGGGGGKRSKVVIGQMGQTGEREVNLPFMPVDLTFENLAYEVKASTGKEMLKLLHEVSGVFKAGRMCALMGSSGAGKTTLMDVIAMRKTSGTITGEIRLNGHLQERNSFLRCSGYVEQFDVQQPELTVRETVEFCARLRLDASDPAIGNDEGKMRFAAHVLETMELTNIQNLQVGSFEEGGLTFEQRKRLAVACELAGSPSVLFLDEPTSGLDSRGAIVVMRAMKRIADQGRTVCATIHQPSYAVFELFDDLLLLMRGGRMVFFGELGPECVQLIKYFESRGTKHIEYGENPAAWMLRAFAGADTADEATDWPEQFKASDQYVTMNEKIRAITEATEESKRITFDKVFATSFGERFTLINKRIYTIYRRSPAYNLARLMIAVFYAFILGSVFLQGKGRRERWKESEVNALLGTMFLSLIIIGVASISMAVPVAKTIRDVFYKHRASGMLTHTSLSWALFFGETPYICLISLLFGVIYYATVGLFHTGWRFFLFWVFFTLNVACYSYFGQAFICLVQDIPTAGALVGALIGFNIFFSGFVVKPQYFVGAFQIGFWTAPGRYAYEGLVSTQFLEVNTTVVATPQSPYYLYRNCTADPCEGHIDDFVNFTFGGKFSIKRFWLDFGILMFCMVLAKGVTEFSLGKFNYVNT